MINRKFKKNWNKIINFNSKVNIIEDIKDLEENVRIPLTPIIVKSNILYYLFEIVYPNFVNDQQNILDVIVSDEEIKNKTLGIYLYPTKKAGIHEKIEKLPIDTIKIKERHLENFDELFNELQEVILKKRGIKISSLRLFKKSAIETINKYSESIESHSFYEFFIKFFNLIQDLFENGSFYLYPEPNIYRFLKKLIMLLNGIRLSQIFKLLYELTPAFNFVILLNSKNLKFTLHAQKKLSKTNKSELFFKINTLNDFETKENYENSINYMIQTKQKFNTDYSIILNQNDVLALFSDLFELKIPVTKESIKLLIQKVLFWYKRFEVRWNIFPRPSIYNNLIRFIIRFFGFNLNIKKVSYWAIPELIFNFINYYFGLNSKVLVIYTNIHKNRKVSVKAKNYLESASEKIFLLEIENSSFIKVIPINKTNLFSSKNYSLELIKSKISETHGFISSILIIDRYLLMRFLELFVFNFSKFSLFKLLKMLKLFKEKSYFQICPEIEPYQLFKQKGGISFLRIILPILIDKHEF
ncbi:MAG: hypothetical protein ACFE9T_12245 [Promethearchaeota archaeon]